MTCADIIRLIAFGSLWFFFSYIGFIACAFAAYHLHVHTYDGNTTIACILLATVVIGFVVCFGFFNLGANTVWRLTLPIMSVVWAIGGFITLTIYNRYVRH